MVPRSERRPLGLASAVSLAIVSFIDFYTARSLSLVAYVEPSLVGLVQALEVGLSVVCAIGVALILITWPFLDREAHRRLTLAVLGIQTVGLVLDILALLMTTIFGKHENPLYLLLEAALVHISTVQLFSVWYATLDHHRQLERREGPICDVHSEGATAAPSDTSPMNRLRGQSPRSKRTILGRRLAAGPFSSLAPAAVLRVVPSGAPAYTVRGMIELDELVGQSPAIESVRRDLRRLLAVVREGRRLPAILIQGETGTGKGLVAKLLHRHGPRARGPFVDLNCAAIPETLLEGELFGYERAAFPAARRAKAGLLQSSSG